jgi:hypothetical protein
MKNVIVTRKNGSTAGAEMSDPTQWIADCVAGNVWGKPERIVEAIEGTYDTADVLEEIDELVSPAVEEVVDENGVVTIPASPAVFKKMVKLKAEYTIEIQDISQQVEQEKTNREALEYLASTDWYVIREMDSGISCPSDIKEARIAARASIKR